MNQQLVIPMAVYVFLMFGLIQFNFLTRLSAIRTKQLTFKFFETFQGAQPSERVIVIGRHFDNQFQVPILFFITCLVAMTLSTVQQTTIFLAWAFVGSRAIHSFIHLGSNKVSFRVVAYGMGWLIVALMWVQILMGVK